MVLAIVSAMAAPSMARGASYYFRASTKALGSNFGKMDTSTSADSLASTGWTVATKAPPNYAPMSYANTRGSSSFGTTPQPAAGPNNTITGTSGDAFRTDAVLAGSFAASTWTFTIAGQASGAAVDGTVGFRIRVWKSANGDGTSPTELTTTTLATPAQSAALGTNAAWTVTWAAPKVTLSNEYLFVQLAAFVGSASSSASSAWVMMTGATWSRVDIAGAFNVTYYVDPAGSDANDGKTTTTAWATLTNPNATTLNPGDSLLFKCGGSWTGRYQILGSGTQALPIVIGAYGSCASSYSGFPQLPTGPPVINGGGNSGESGSAIYVRNSNWVTIQDLEVTNCGDSPCTMSNVTGSMSGIYVRATNFGVMTGITIRHNYIHNVDGRSGSGLTDKRTGGIIFEIYDDSTLATRFDQIDVSDNKVATCDDVAFAISYFPGQYSTMTPYASDPGWNARRVTNFTMRRNDFGDLAKNAAIFRFLDGGIIEWNAMHDNAFRAQSGNTLYTRLCNGTLVQFNEFYNNLATKTFDGSAIDADLDTVYMIAQYNYIHDNADGAYWTYTNQTNPGNVFRWNLVVNCHDVLFAAHNTGAGVDVYQNTFYQPDAAGAVTVVEEKMDSSLTCTAAAPCTYSYRLWDNIFYLGNAGTKYTWMTPTASKSVTRSIRGNLFYGVHPDTEPYDPAKVTLDPLFVSPGYAGTGVMATGSTALLAGYQLKPGSPALGTGVGLAGLVTGYHADMWGRPISWDRADIGAGHSQAANGAIQMSAGSAAGSFK